MDNTGNVIRLKHESRILMNNPLKDPFVRDLMVYTPPGYDSGSSRQYPVIFGIPGFTGFGEFYLQKSFFKQPFNEMLDELINEEKMPPVLYVMPDCLTKYGGSQYINSSATGNYEDYIIEELVPYVDENFHTSGNRAIMGGSSGGIGSFTLAARHPDIFYAFADHSGDSAFEYCYQTDIPHYITAMDKYDYSLERFVESIQDRSIPKDDDFNCILNLTAMAACYSPNPDCQPLGFELPFNIRTGEMRPQIWNRWLAHDPVRMVDNREIRNNLKKLKLIYIDCGKKDQFNLLLGARQLHDKLQFHKISHHYEEYDSDHFLLRKEQKRKSIPLLANILT